MRVDEMRVGEMKVDEMRVGEMRVDEMRVGEMRVDEMSPNLIHSVTTLTCAISKQDEINSAKSYDQCSL